MTEYVRLIVATLLLLVTLACAVAESGGVQPIAFNVPAQSADQALLEFSRQARVDILFSFDDLKKVRANAVTGHHHPPDALEILLRGTGFVARRTAEAKWVVTPTGPPAGTIKGKIRAPDGSPARRARVVLSPPGIAELTDGTGEFRIGTVAPGKYTLIVTAEDHRPLQIVDVTVVANRTTVLAPQSLQRSDELTRLEPFVVRGRATHISPLDHSDALFGPRRAGGNLDLARTESDALPYMIFNRSQISRSGVVNLNEFLQRELIDSSAGTLPPEQNGKAEIFVLGSSNLTLRGFQSEETVILVNGRRLPEVLVSNSEYDIQPPDVNVIPLSLVQQVEVLPVSASALYSGNAVGGVINIVLRPDVDANATEVNATYTNTLRGFDAPQSSVSLLHARSLAGGALRLRLNASFTQAVPATEAELAHRQRRRRLPPAPQDAVYGATPNVRSTPTPDNADVPLFDTGTAIVTSVSPGADGRGGLAAFSGREGLRNTSLFDSPGDFSTGLESLDYPYGRNQSRATYFGSVVYDMAPWLQLAVDGTYSETVVDRGLDVLAADLDLPASSAFNPFGRDVKVSLLETAPALGKDYSQARFEAGSIVAGALLKLPGDWQIALDGQYAEALVRYRALSGADLDRWQSLVDRGIYNPLRDTQLFGPPVEFYDEVLVYRQARGRYAHFGNYNTMDLALRAMNETLPLPTGAGVVNVGVDYRRNQLAKYKDERRYSDGTLAHEPIRWDSRSLVRYSVFGELQADIVPAERLPTWIKRAEADVAVRYVAASSSREANLAPTLGTKVSFASGLAFRGSVTQSKRFPTPHMSRMLLAPPTDEGTIPVRRESVFDPRRQQEYVVVVDEVLVPDLLPESAVTQTAGLLFHTGDSHQFRAALDFVDTRKVNELSFIDSDRAVANESLWPERVHRGSAEPGAPGGAGLIHSVVVSRANLHTRHSQDWTVSIDYRWDACLGGTLEAYARTLYFQRYRVQTLPGGPFVDELNHPDNIVPVLKYRANFGASWANKTHAFGWDGHYFHSRVIPQAQWAAQGHDRIRPFWQFDVFTQVNVARWLPWESSRYGLRLQFRLNNVFDVPFPKYVNDAFDAGVQPYGDWRGRTYSVSLTASF